MGESDLVRICILCKRTEIPLEKNIKYKFTHGILSRECYRKYYLEYYSDEIKFSHQTCESLFGPYELLPDGTIKNLNN